MIVDETVLARADRSYDLVIVGAGAAGLTLAQALGRVNRRVLVIEAGAFRETQQGRADLAGVLAQGSTHPAPDLYRVRALGGTTRIWGGRCIPFDPIDFERRTWVAGSGWPIAHADVAPYYAGALDAAEAGRDAFDPRSVLPGTQGELVRGLDGDDVETTLERFSKPTNFFKRFERLLQDSPTIDLLPHAVVTRVVSAADGNAVEALEIVARSGARHRVRASAYVLAGGGLEVTRLLLASNDVRRNGLGNGGDTLGRFYMSHLCTTAATIALDRGRAPVMFDYARDADGIYVRRRLWLTAGAQRRHRLLNTTFRTHLPDPGDPAHGNAILSAMFLSKRFVQREYAAKFNEAPVPASAYARHVANVLRQPLPLTRFARMWMRDRTMARRKLPSVVLASLEHRYQLEFHAEQAPNHASRVSLSDGRDRHGMQRLHIDWRLADLDIESLCRAHAVLAERLAATGCGTLVFDKDVLADRARRLGIVGGHHIGTTRMSTSEREGVVDGQCRVHGIANLYVASASVLPTSGQANPTLTVLALALRLADHLVATAPHVPTATAALAEVS